MQPLPPFKVELEPNSSNASICELRALFQVRIKVESFKPRRLIPQYSKCQLIRHTKTYCSRLTRCVMCAGSHQLSSCPHPRAEPATCANCARAHPANFCGCKAFIAKQSKSPHKAVDKIHRCAPTASSQTLRPFSYIPIFYRGVVVPPSSSARYLGAYLDQCLTYKEHIRVKKMGLDLHLNRLRWLLHKQSALSLSNKRLLYVATLCPLWAYPAQLRGYAAKHLRIKLQRFQNMVLRLITGAPWYLRNSTVHQDFRVATVDGGRGGPTLR